MCKQTAVSKYSYRNWHLIAECTDKRAVKVRTQILEAVKVLLRKHVRREVAEVLLIPWMLDSEGRLLDMGTLESRRSTTGWCEIMVRCGEVARAIKNIGSDRIDLSPLTHTERCVV